MSEGTISFHLGNSEQLTFKVVTVHYESVPEHHGSISQDLQMARKIKESLRVSVFPEFFIHTLDASGEPSKADLFFIKGQGGQSRSQENCWL